jgi:hypothetical protein
MFAIVIDRRALLLTRILDEESPAITAEGALKGRRLDEIVQQDASELSFFQNLHDPASDVAFINPGWNQ